MQSIKKHKSKIIVIITTIILLIGLSYAWLQLVLEGEKRADVIAGELSLVLDDTMEGGITITKAIPVSDEEGKKEEYIPLH